MEMERRGHLAGPIWQWSAAEIAAAIRDHDVSATDVMSAVVERTALENPAVNAIVEERFYILSEERWRDAANARLDDVREGRNPTFAPPV